MACTRHALLLLPQFFMETIMKRLSLFTLCLLLAGVMAASSTYAAPPKTDRDFGRGPPLLSSSKAKLHR